MTTMPFGKNRGQPLEEIPADYLRWLMTIELNGWLRTAVEVELESRRKPERPRALARLDVTAWHRKLSLRFHPDRVGGSKEAMQAVNAGRDLLEEMLR